MNKTIDKDQYIAKLTEFNATDKYERELLFLSVLIGEDAEYVLDYGCGLGKAMNFIAQSVSGIVRGYDVVEYIPEFRYAVPMNEKFDLTYFMHSLAHIPNIEEVLEELRTSMVVMITPNREWMEALPPNPEYIPDPTVVKHFSMSELNALVSGAGFDVMMSGQFGQESNGKNERLFIVGYKKDVK